MTAPASWSFRYHYIANQDPVRGRATGLPAGYLALTVRAGGEVLGRFTPAPIPGAAPEASYAMTIPRERAAALRERLLSSGYERVPSPAQLDMGDGEPITIGLAEGAAEPALRVLPLGQVPRSLHPFLNDMTALWRELQGHPRR